MEDSRWIELHRLGLKLNTKNTTTTHQPSLPKLCYRNERQFIMHPHNNTNYNENLQQNNLKKIELWTHSNWPGSKHKILFTQSGLISICLFLNVCIYCFIIILNLSIFKFAAWPNLAPSWNSATLKIWKVPTCKMEQQPTHSRMIFSLWNCWHRWDGAPKLRETCYGNTRTFPN